MGLGYYIDHFHKSKPNFEYLANHIINTTSFLFMQTNTSNKLDIKFTRFLRRLMHFFKPSSNKFSHQDIGLNRHIPSYVTTGVKLIDWLLKNAEVCVIGLSNNNLFEFMLNPIYLS